MKFKGRLFLAALLISQTPGFAMQPKEQFLTELASTDLNHLWIQFLKVQSDLFFEKEFAPIFDQTWWLDAQNVLEIGSGNGDLLAKIATKFPEKTYVGFDQQASAVALAQSQFSRDRLTFMQGDAQCFNPSLSQQFDLIIFRLTLQHLKQPKLALEHAYHYLKPEGHIYIIESFDSARQCSYPIPILEEAIQKLNEQNQQYAKGNRLISLEIQKEQTTALSPYFFVERASHDEEGHTAPDFPQVIIYSKDAGAAYLDYTLLFLEILKKGWNISTNFQDAYEEANFFVQHEEAWLRPGKHLLLLKKNSHCAPSSNKKI